MNTDIVYVYDPGVDEALDWQIRCLLGTCFAGPMFRNKRYNAELPPHRWIVRDGEHALAAHLALHDKRIETRDGELRIIGIAEVAVHPHFRGKGLAKRLLDAAHAWATGQGIAFSLLFGSDKVYGSSGYVHASNAFRFYDTREKTWVTRPIASALIRTLGGPAWPEGAVDLRGPMF